ncbi:hypothetical protein SAMN06265339_0647 [Desulfurobacterium pacificum]|uniref:Uncharacterized protein n=1 Tax=Desulfurobacterium pacificum TaxID=240166 RepID=A0ABY1NG40_9BACT|nr:hypothetical protein SAMN06265339_0647 [Desulfurobacterium pacificum]
MENSPIKKLMFYGVFGIYLLIVIITSIVIIGMQ